MRRHYGPDLGAIVQWVAVANFAFCAAVVTGETAAAGLVVSAYVYVLAIAA